MPEKDHKYSPDEQAHGPVQVELEIITLSHVEASRLQDEARLKYSAAFEALKDK